MRLIDADALPIKFDGHIVSVWKNDIDNAPTIDAVPVVRCKDCKHRWKDGHAPLEDGHPDFTCDFEGSLDDDWYCADGERREDG